jgi:hypothetical protein
MKLLKVKKRLHELLLPCLSFSLYLFVLSTNRRKAEVTCNPSVLYTILNIHTAEDWCNGINEIKTLFQESAMYKKFKELLAVLE